MKARLLLIALCGALAAPGLSRGAGGYPWPQWTVLPVFFVPTDWDAAGAEVQDEAAAIRTALAEIQAWYAGAFGARALRLNDLQLVQALGPKEDYGIVWNGNNIYEDGVEIVANLEHLVVSELHGRGFPTPPGQNEDGYSVLIFVKGAGGWAGGRELGAADGGWAILGDWCIDSLQGQVPEGAYWWSGRRLQIGAAAHELGHTFGLPHPDAYGGDWSTTVMGWWWDWPNLGLNAWETQLLETDKDHWFSNLLLEAPPLQAGAPVLLRVTGAAPGQPVWLGWSRRLDLFAVPQLDLVLGIGQPLGVLPVRTASGAGEAQWNVTVPAAAAGRTVRLEAVQRGEVSGIATRPVN